MITKLSRFPYSIIRYYELILMGAAYEDIDPACASFQVSLSVGVRGEEFSPEDIIA